MKTRKDLIQLTVICIVIIAVNIVLYAIYSIHGGIAIFSLASLYIIAICIGGWVKVYKENKAEAAYYKELGEIGDADFYAQQMEECDYVPDEFPY